MSAAAFISEEEAKRQMEELRAQPAPEKELPQRTGTRYFKIPDGKWKGTVSIDKHGTFSWRGYKRHKVYSSTLEKVVAIMIQKLAEAEAREARKPRGRFLVRRGRV